MTDNKWKCPKHNANLQTIEDCPGALVHTGCREIFTVINGWLCVLDGNRWKDVKSGEYREAPKD